MIQFVRDQDGQLSDYMEWLNGMLHWKLVFIKEAQDWELESMAHPKKDLHLGVLQASVEDTSLFPWKCV